MLRVVFFGAGGPASVSVLDALADVATVTAVVVPAAATFRQRLRLRPLTAAFRELTARRGLRVLPFGTDFGDCDLICVGAFPRLISRAMRARARLGGINVHPSLLPRHRGPDPLFWTYFDDDLLAGVTLHWLADGFDDGDVIAQRSVEIERGTSGLELYHLLASRGAELIREHLPLIGDGTAARAAQDHGRATHEPSPSAWTWVIDYNTWPAEKLWHFLRGVEHRNGFALPDRHGRLHPIGRVERWDELAHEIAPGSVRGNEVFTKDGSVRWSRVPLLRRVRHALRPIPNR